jgi:hypothetical protein
MGFRCRSVGHAKLPLFAPTLTAKIALQSCSSHEANGCRETLRREQMTSKN